MERFTNYQNVSNLIIEEAEQFLVETKRIETNNMLTLFNGALDLCREAREQGLKSAVVVRQKVGFTYAKPEDLLTEDNRAIFKAFKDLVQFNTSVTHAEIEGSYYDDYGTDNFIEVEVSW